MTTLTMVERVCKPLRGDEWLTLYRVARLTGLNPDRDRRYIDELKARGLVEEQVEKRAANRYPVHLFRLTQRGAEFRKNLLNTEATLHPQPRTLA